MLAFLLFSTAIVCLGAATQVWIKTRDVYHPVILFAPMLMFLYVYQPITLVASGVSETFFTGNQLIEIQLINLLGVAAVVSGAYNMRMVGIVRTKTHSPLSISLGLSLMRCAMVLGSVGMGLWLKTISNTGGFSAAFGNAYGGGWDDSGYVRDLAQYCPTLAVLLLSYLWGSTTARAGIIGPMTLFAIPMLSQGILGARRGPTFVLAVVCIFAFDFGRGRRPSLTRGVLFCTGIALTLLFLITNRGNLYIGSSQALQTTSMSSFFEPNSGTEYVVGGGEILHVKATGKPGWGRNWLAEIAVRPIPRAIWQNKWKDYAEWSGSRIIDPSFHIEVSETVGWTPAVGAPPGIIPETYAEWSWLYLPVLWWIGRLHAHCWQRARTRQGKWALVYTVCAALSIYLFIQGPLDTIYRYILTIGILAAILGITEVSERKAMRARSLQAPGQFPVYQLSRERYL